jgi:isopenicillin N synthase-like dioxygenase
LNCVFTFKVPVAAVSGLEVFDEGADQWYRPELTARRHWRAMRVSKGDDPDAFTETVQEQGGTTRILPWYSRYLVLMPGDLLQITSGDEVAAAVHRVVATSQSVARLSAPILLRGRPGTILDCHRYLGGTGRSALLDSCHGMTIESIHDALQPEPSQK